MLPRAGLISYDRRADNPALRLRRKANPSKSSRADVSTFEWLVLRLHYRRMRIGSLALKSNLFLSPLAGYTNLPFRLTLRELGGLDLATTDLVNARSLLEKNPKAFKLIETCPVDRPLAVQLFGAVPEEMRDAAVMLQERGIS